MEKKEIKKLIFQAYNLSTEDREVSFIERTTQSLNEWFEKIYSDRRKKRVKKTKDEDE